MTPREPVLLIDGLSAVWGGGVVYLQNFLRQYPGRVHLVVNFQNRADFEPLASEFSRLTLHWIHAPGYLTKLWFYFFGLPRLCADLGVEVLYEPANILYRKPPGVKVVLTVQNLAPFWRHPRSRCQRWNWRLRWAAIRFLTSISVARADCLIAISEFGRGLLSTEYPGQKSRFFPRVAYHGVPELPPPDPRGFREFLTGLGVGDAFLFSPAHLLWYKNIETVLYALPAVLARHPNLHYVVGGHFTTPDYAARLFDLTRRLGLEPRVHFTGEVNRTTLADLYRACEIMLFPSLIENMPFTLLEALAAGCPILAAATPVNAEVLGGAGRLVAPTRPVSWSVAIQDLLADPAQRQELSQKAVARARFFTWDRPVAVLADAVANPGGRKR